MSRDTLATLALAALLVAGGGLAWWSQLQPDWRPEPASLSAIAPRLGSFVGKDLPLEETVESILEADYNVQRDYWHPLGDLVSLYVGYYGTERGGTPEHTPRVCYGAHGWEIVREEALPRGDDGALVREYLVTQQGQQVLVHFWYRSYRSASLDSLPALRWDHVIGRLRDGRGDGALIRLSTPVVDGDLLAARSRLQHFARLLEPELAAHWPDEKPATPTG